MKKKYYLQFNIIHTNQKTGFETVRMTYQLKKSAYVLDMHTALKILNMYKIPYHTWMADNITQHVEIPKSDFYKFRRFLIAFRMPK